MWRAAFTDTYITLDCKSNVHAACAACSCACHDA